MTYDILKETFCIYCQKYFGNPNELQAHVMRDHSGTFAASSIRKARKFARTTKP